MCAGVCSYSLSNCGWRLDTVGVMLFEESLQRLVVMLNEEEVIERPEWKGLNGGGDNLGGLLSD